MTRPNRTTHIRVAAPPLRALFAALLVAGITAAQAEPGPPHGPPGASPVPSAEELATVPALTTTQQIELRKILVERRDAHEAVHEKSRAALEAQQQKDRGEHERIDEQSSERVRKLLGDDGFKSYAEWQFAHHRPLPGRGDGPAAHGAGPMRGARSDERPGPPPEPGAPPAPGTNS